MPSRATGDAPRTSSTHLGREPSRWDRFGAAEIDALLDALHNHVPRTEAQGRVVRYMTLQIEEARHEMGL